MSTPAGTPSLLIIVPAYNEAASVGRVVGEIHAAVPGVPVVVIDDCSEDATATVAREAGADVLELPHHLGLGGGVQAGYKLAYELGYDYVIRIDGDGQHDPDEIPKFLECYASQPVALIIGQRDFSKMPLPRSLSNPIGRWLFSWAVGQDIPDNQSGYRLLSRRMMEAIKERNLFHAIVVNRIDVAPLIVLRTGSGAELDGAYVKLKVLDGAPDSFTMQGYSVTARLISDLGAGSSDDWLQAILNGLAAVRSTECAQVSHR